MPSAQDLQGAVKRLEDAGDDVSKLMQVRGGSTRSWKRQDEIVHVEGKVGGANAIERKDRTRAHAKNGSLARPLDPRDGPTRSQGRNPGPDE